MTQKKPGRSGRMAAAATACGSLQVGFLFQGKGKAASKNASLCYPFNSRATDIRVSRGREPLDAGADATGQSARILLLLS